MKEKLPVQPDIESVITSEPLETIAEIKAEQAAVMQSDSNGDGTPEPDIVKEPEGMNLKENMDEAEPHVLTEEPVQAEMKEKVIPVVKGPNDLDETETQVTTPLDKTPKPVIGLDPAVESSIEEVIASEPLAAEERVESSISETEVQVTENALPGENLEILAETSENKPLVTPDFLTEGAAVLAELVVPEVIHGEDKKETLAVQESTEPAGANLNKEASGSLHDISADEPVLPPAEAKSTGRKAKDKASTHGPSQGVEAAKEGVVAETIAITENHVGEEEEEEEEVLVEDTAEDYSRLSRVQLIEMLEKVVHEPDINKIKAQVALIKVAYLNVTKEEHHEKLLKAGENETAETAEAGETVEFTDPLEERYKIAFNTYKVNKTRFNEQLEREKLENLEAKKHILEELKVLISSEETLKKTYDDFKSLQDKWKTIGIVPKSEVNSLWQNYHFLLEKFFDKVKINRELKDLDQKKNLEHKVELCEKVEELLLETSVIKAFKKLQEYHDEWKEIGPVPQDKRDEVWDRFKNASEKLNERRRDFYGKIHADQDANYAAKVLLCEKAEQVSSREYISIKEWQDSTAEVNDLLKLWKTIGAASVKLNNEVWNRFKGFLDAYFANKKEFFGRLKDQQLHNYNLKVDLCVQAENLRLSTEWKNSTREMIKLQEDWKKIGPVPRKHSDKIWKRFRHACDDFFSHKAEFFKEVKSSESDNLRIKEDIIRQLKEIDVDKDKTVNLDLVKELQRRWMETGHVPIREKERLQAEFKEAVNKVYDKLKVDAIEISTLNYKSKFDNIKDQPDALRIINKERVTLQSRIDQMKDEILLWENNIGFFANSKQVNVLKIEFEAKINRAKDELAKMEAKMKFLRKAAREQEQHQ